MLARALALWSVLLVVAFVNGFVREAWLVPATGERVAHALSSLSLSLAIALLASVSIEWIRPLDAADAVQIGLLWVGMTLIFEFGAGHYLFRKPWVELLADYNVLDGRIWVLVLLVTALSPLVAAWNHGVR